jgi:thiamine-monophosphate kinase
MKSEFEFIQDIRHRYSLRKIGDDCAVLPKDFKTDLVMTTDLLVEDIDFRRDWTTPEFLGHKALAVSLSDVAAMGAKPVWAMISIGLPEVVWKSDFAERFYDGYFRLARKFDVEIVGGDVSRTPDRIVVDSIAAGEVVKERAVLRSGARAGDLIFVTGGLGGAAAGLKLLENGVRYNNDAKIWQHNLMLKQLQPQPQIQAAKDLNEFNLASAMIDLSDGLSGDLMHLCRESKVGAKIFADRIPFHKNLLSVTDSFDEKLDLALNGGEDYELLFTVNPKKNFLIENTLKTNHFFRIGEITVNIEIMELFVGEKTRVLQPKTFQHF